MTKNRVVAYQWIRGGVTHIEVLSFWQTVMKNFHIGMRDLKNRKRYPDNLRDKDPIANWTVMLDNAGIQRHSSVTGFFFKHQINLVYNAAYSPQLMPVETLFSMVERFCCTRVFKG